jgi:hypothetical protein
MVISRLCHYLATNKVINFSGQDICMEYTPATGMLACYVTLQTPKSI